MGIYIQEHKIGYTFSRIQKINSNLKLTNRMKINLSMMGQAEQVVSSFAGITDTNFGLKEFEFDFESTNRKFRANGAVKNSQFTIEVRTGGETKKDFRTVTEPIYPISALGKLAVQKSNNFSRDFSIKLFDPTILSVIDVKVKNLGRDKISINNIQYELNKIETNMLGLVSTMWIDDQGFTRKEVSPPGLTSIEENREKALSEESVTEELDILTLFSVPVETLITEARSLKYLKLEIFNVDTTGLKLETDNQKIVKDIPLTLEINAIDSFAQVNLPITTQTEYRQPSLYIQSDNQEIIRTARQIIGQEKIAGNAGQMILDWVYKNVTKRATASLPSALDVLQNLEGDCNEHAILYTALCRAVGIPSQICVGLVYVDGRFYYHAWNRIFLGKWIVVDPTFNQFPADATHIQFAEGELIEQAKVLKIVNAIKIRITEFKP